MCGCGGMGDNQFGLKCLDSLEFCLVIYDLWIICESSPLAESSARIYVFSQRYGTSTWYEKLCCTILVSVVEVIILFILLKFPKFWSDFGAGDDFRILGVALVETMTTDRYLALAIVLIDRAWREDYKSPLSVLIRPMQGKIWTGIQSGTR